MRLLLVLAVAGVVLRPPDRADASVDREGDAITSGLGSSSDHAVVALMSGSRQFCTGTLIAPDIVLTAAHCVVGPTIDRVVFATGLGPEPVAVAVLAATPHPDFDRFALVNDLAILILVEEVAVQPVRLSPEGTIERSLIGGPVRVVGYGLADASDDVGGVRLTGWATVKWVTATSLVLQPGPSLPCFGDSGGPALVTVAGEELLAGTVSVGDSQCATYARYTLVDSAAAEFVRDYVADAGGSDVGCAASATPPSSNRATAWVVLIAVVVASRRRRRHCVDPTTSGEQS